MNEKTMQNQKLNLPGRVHPIFILLLDLSYIAQHLLGGFVESFSDFQSHSLPGQSVHAVAGSSFPWAAAALTHSSL